jgi:hypothetical protein
MTRTIRVAAMTGCVLALVAAAAFADNFVQVTTRTGNDMIDWGQLGPPFTQIDGSAPWTSMLGATGVASDSGALERRDEGSGWIGVFNLRDHLLWNQDNGNAIDIHFNTPISLGGAQIQDDFFGVYSGCIQALGSFGSSPVFCVQGTNNGAEDGSAPFIGIQDTTGANITDLLFTTTEDNTPPNSTAINQLSFTSGGKGVVPEPITLVLFGSGLLGLGRARRKLR